MMKPSFGKHRFAIFILLFAALAVAQPVAGMNSAVDSNSTGVTDAISAPGSEIGPSVGLDGSYGPGDPPGQDSEAVRRLKQKARGSVAVSTKNSTKKPAFVRAGRNGDLLPGVSSGAGADKARGFLIQHGDVFGVRDVQAELVMIESAKDQFGATHVSYRQVYQGVPVFGGILRAHLDANNNLTAVNGVFVPDLNLATKPKLSAADAGRLAIAAVVADPPRSEANADIARPLKAADLSAASTTLYVYRIGLVRNAPGTSQLVYQVEVTNGSNVRDFVFVHAHSGKLVNRYSAIHDNHDGLFRVLYEQNTGNQVWQEGDAFPGGLNTDQQNIVNFSGDSYYYFLNAFERNSYDGLGAHMRSVNNDPTIACPNANWNGATTNYCNGVTSDDVVAHEWGHAYTEYTHNLIYQWQSGALNESYSDIWGEVVDQLNGAGTDAPAPVRTVGECSTHTAARPTLIINSPAAIAEECAAAPAAFGPAVTFGGVTGNVVLADDGVAPGSDACTALVNGAAIAGNIALVDRGTCGFAVKVKLAQDAGAIAVVVANNAVGPPAPMGGADPTITIPSVQISLAHGNLIKSQLANTVNVTMRLKDQEDSYRWLMGEDSTAFGGAIRDMWNPTCIADPGKVTDAEYHCASTDGGGVHTNSGVPNHGFALLVDGGTYNDYAINAIGMVKAAHLYWRAQTVYQTPTSDFTDHADALEASCTDLIGQTLPALSTGTTDPGSSGQSIAAADCAEVSDMIAAIELRTDPTEQCNFQPILAQNPPPICAKTKNPLTFYSEDFERGLRGWRLLNEGVFAGWPGLNWVQDTSLPGGRSGAAAFAADPDIGNCDGGAGDVSGVMRLVSPVIHLPFGNAHSFRLTFEHYIATEAGWDGGNLKLSINGGAFALVPASAFLFNPYNATLQTAAAGNTNPLAGEPGYTGTDGGSLGGTWGQSQVNLAALGVMPGDTIRLRFDFGMDGCTGVDGWYVDNVKIRACNAKKED
jgi:Zn-dependent metalloprotease